MLIEFPGFQGAYSVTIDTAIRSYIERPDTQYAILVNGEWGVGKTHYVVKELLPSLTDAFFCYVSVYGMQSVQELKQSVTEALAETSRELASYQSVVVCIDDIERWHGNLELCLSYINFLTEHEGRKCLLIGNMKELPKKNAEVFVKAQEKTIRQVIHFNRSMSSVIEISLGQVEYPSKSARQFIRSLVNNNQIRLVELMKGIKLYNIRLLSESLQLFAYAYRHHSGVFKRSKQLTFTWYLALLSVLVLVKRRLITEQQQIKLFQSDHSTNHGFEFLSSIGYFDHNDPEQLSSETRLLLDTVFYRLDKISLYGIFSLVNHGYYIASDFKDDFSNWDDDEVMQIYLDREEFYSLDNEQAQLTFETIYNALIVEMSVRTPLTILFLAERIVEDIANGVIDINPVNFKREVIDVAERLYQAGQMESVGIDVFDIAGDRFINCRAIHRYITDKNQSYLGTVERDEIARFWEAVGADNADVVTLLEHNNPLRVLSETASAAVAIATLERLDNRHLRDIAIWLDQREEVDPGMLIAAQSVIFEIMLGLRDRYTNAFGIRANHFRSIINALNALNEMADDTLPPGLTQILAD